jgi:methylated-DNA-protein-cysteine methyltransferase-like protein
MINYPPSQDRKAPQHACSSAPPASPAARREALFITLAQVPAGNLVSYGQLAALAGLGRAARWVGRTLSQLPCDSRLPWHRVIAASGRLSLPADSPAGAEQRARLHSEGIDLTNDRVNLRIHGWRP